MQQTFVTTLDSWLDWLDSKFPNFELVIWVALIRAKRSELLSVITSARHHLRRPTTVPLSRISTISILVYLRIDSPEPRSTEQRQQ